MVRARRKGQVVRGGTGVWRVTGAGGWPACAGGDRGREGLNTGGGSVSPARVSNCFTKLLVLMVLPLWCPVRLRFYVGIRALEISESKITGSEVV